MPQNCPITIFKKHSKGRKRLSPHIVQTTESLVGDGSVTLLERSCSAKPGEGCTSAIEILILGSLKKALNELLSFCH